MLINALMTEPKKRGMLLMLALVFGAFSINFASGLVIFIIASTVTGIVQTYLQKHLKVV
jgi:membrane protein insertase Oxa1/YidC/SpoIIIJ